jgi:hypothetical protein
MGGGGGGAASLGVSFPRQEAQLRHIFSKREGHVPDTLENRRLIREVANNADNHNGTDKWGNSNYSKLLEDGSQVWVRVRDGIINDAGINKNIRSWDNDTGFNENPFRKER